MISFYLLFFVLTTVMLYKIITIINRKNIRNCHLEPYNILQSTNNSSKTYFVKECCSPQYKNYKLKKKIINFSIGTYFNCIMFMVASSVVLTLVVLNYHHRTADIHTMGPWVICVLMFFVFIIQYLQYMPEKLNGIYINALIRSIIAKYKSYKLSIVE